MASHGLDAASDTCVFRLYFKFSIKANVSHFKWYLSHQIQIHGAGVIAL